MQFAHPLPCKTLSNKQTSNTGAADSDDSGPEHTGDVAFDLNLPPYIADEAARILDILKSNLQSVKSKDPALGGSALPVISALLACQNTNANIISEKVAQDWAFEENVTPDVFNALLMTVRCLWEELQEDGHSYSGDATDSKTAKRCTRRRSTGSIAGSPLSTPIPSTSFENLCSQYSIPYAKVRKNMINAQARLEQTASTKGISKGDLGEYTAAIPYAVFWDIAGSLVDNKLPERSEFVRCHRLNKEVFRRVLKWLYVIEPLGIRGNATPARRITGHPKNDTSATLPFHHLSRPATKNTLKRSSLVLPSQTPLKKHKSVAWAMDSFPQKPAPPSDFLSHSPQRLNEQPVLSEVPIAPLTRTQPKPESLHMFANTSSLMVPQSNRFYISGTSPPKPTSPKSFTSTKVMQQAASLILPSPTKGFETLTGPPAGATPESLAREGQELRDRIVKENRKWKEIKESWSQLQHGAREAAEEVDQLQDDITRIQEELRRKQEQLRNAEQQRWLGEAKLRAAEPEFRHKEAARAKQLERDQIRQDQLKEWLGIAKTKAG